jgi:hypothetical protein
MPAGVVTAWLRAPLLHFLCVGAFLFLCARRPPEPAHRPTIVITPARLREMRDTFTRQTGLTPTPDDERTLLAREIETELVYQEALRLGLDRGDRSIRWQLVQKMTFLDGLDDDTADRDALYREARALGFDRDDPVIRRMLVEKLRLLVKSAAAQAPIDDATLEAYLHAHPDRYRQPDRFTFRHVFFARERRGDRAESDARAALARMTTRPTDGDAFPVGRSLRAQAPVQIAKSFGDAFANALTTQPVGAWTVHSSAFGWHLVRIDAVVPGDVPVLANVRSRVAADVIAERGDAEFAGFVARLRDRWLVRVEAGAGRTS